MKNRYMKSIVAAVVAAALLAVPVSATEEVSLSADELLEQKNLAEADLAALREDLAAKIQEIDELEMAGVAKADEIAACELDIADAEARQAAQYAAMKLRIKYAYESGGNGGQLFQAIISSEDIAEALNKAEYSTEISSYDRERIESYIATQEELKALKETLEQERQDLEDIQSDCEFRQAELNELIAQKEVEVADFEEQYQMALQMALAQDAALQQAVYYAVSTGDYSALEQYEASHPGTALASSGNWSALLDSAYSWIGTPYSYGGSSRSGVDCSGFVQAVYASMGIDIPRSSGQIRANGTVTDNPQPGDILCWPGHVGIYIDEDHYIDSEQDGTTIQIREFSESRKSSYTAVTY